MCLVVTTPNGVATEHKEPYAAISVRCLFSSRNTSKNISRANKSIIERSVFKKSYESFCANITSNGMSIAFGTEGATPLGFGFFDHKPRVERSAQPWALRRNPFGIGLAESPEEPSQARYDHDKR